jgi:hypothetical protein
MLIGDKINEIQADMAVGADLNPIIFSQLYRDLETIPHENVATLREAFLYLTNNITLRGVQ